MLIAIAFAERIVWRYSMKYIKLVAAAVVLSTLVVAGAAAQTTANLTLSGTVPAILSLTMTAEPGIASLDLTQDINMKIATFVEKSNKRAGYNVSVSSASAMAASVDAPFFKGSDPLNTDQLAYTITYGGASPTFSAGSAILKTSTTRTSKDGVSSEAFLVFAGAALFPNEDSYSDTLTFTIATN